ncbi:hypothetical protein B0J15DRAFT_489125 [Fusarium solani]|uniref:Secreted protein n=1 Tax=Fusarium solani TaxID=169388 RepID=A0A9P9KQI6_FUSSL|nr:uncharacterized protein B0J15DRAFT_489125 [Fusarium solani]KAH7266613.1 hypothetical protein B0J15DRAFT_489125 [Fusarium solani]
MQSFCTLQSACFAAWTALHACISWPSWAVGPRVGWSLKSARLPHMGHLTAPPLDCRVPSCTRDGPLRPCLFFLSRRILMAG